MPVNPMGLLDRAAAALRLLVGAVLILAAIGKVLHPKDFARVVAWVTEAPVGGSVAATLAMATIGVELLLGCLLVLGGRSRWIAIASAVWLVGITVALLKLLFGADAPECGCLSLLSWERTHRTAAGPALVRNAVMIGACIWLAVRGRGETPIRHTGRRPEPIVGAASSRGFTLLEVLVCIAIIAVIIALVVPSLGRVRSSATWTRRQAMHPQLIAAVSAYAIDNREYFPYAARPREPDVPVQIAGFSLPQPYFRAMVWHWPSLIYPAYFVERTAIEPEDMQEYLRSIGWPAESIVRTQYFMADCAFAAPEYYSGRAPSNEQIDLGLFRAMRFSDAAFPSSKGLLIDVGAGFQNPQERDRGENRTSVGRIDGSASWVRWEEYFGDTAWVVDRRDYLGSPGWPVMQTRGGMLGRDPLAR